jgi:predicted nucleic acid-binding protein
MRVGYVDTSCLVAIAFNEPGAMDLARRLSDFDELASSNLLEAELRAVFAREAVERDPATLMSLSWVVPDRPLHREMARVLGAGAVRGTDCWHLATALYLAPEPGTISFLTVNPRQQRIAEALGFRQ